MSNLSIDTLKTRDTGKQVSDKAIEFKNLLEKVGSINDELKGYWEGTDASKYSSAVETQNEFMKKLANTLAESATFLQEVAGRYEKARDETHLGYQTVQMKGWVLNNMDKSKLSYEKMLDMSLGLKNSSSNMEIIFGDIENLFKNVGNDDTWGGSAADEVKKAFNALQAKFPDLYNSIKDCSNYLDSVVREFQAADSSVTGNNDFSNKS